MTHAFWAACHGGQREAGGGAARARRRSALGRLGRSDARGAARARPGGRPGRRLARTQPRRWDGRPRRGERAPTWHPRALTSVLAFMRRLPLTRAFAARPMALGDLTIPNRVMLAPLAGIGNWFVRLQAKRYGAGLAVSEMVSSFAIHYGNEKTLNELLGRAPRRGAAGDPALRARPGDHALRRRAGRRRRRRHPGPEHGLPGPEGDEDRRGRGDDQGPRHGGRGRAAPRREGSGPAGHREAARLDQEGRHRRARAGAPARRRGRRRRHHLPPAQRGRAPQGHAGLRPGQRSSSRSCPCR